MAPPLLIRLQSSCVAVLPPGYSGVSFLSWKVLTHHNTTRKCTQSEADQNELEVLRDELSRMHKELSDRQNVCKWAEVWISVRENISKPFVFFHGVEVRIFLIDMHSRRRIWYVCSPLHFEYAPSVSITSVQQLIDRCFAQLIFNRQLSN